MVVPGGVAGGVPGGVLGAVPLGVSGAVGNVAPDRGPEVTLHKAITAFGLVDNVAEEAGTGSLGIGVDDGSTVSIRMLLDLSIPGTLLEMVELEGLSRLANFTGDVKIEEENVVEDNLVVETALDFLRLVFCCLSSRVFQKYNFVDD